MCVELEGLRIRLDAVPHFFVKCVLIFLTKFGFNFGQIIGWFKISIFFNNVLTFDLL